MKYVQGVRIRYVFLDVFQKTLKKHFRFKWCSFPRVNKWSFWILFNSNANYHFGSNKFPFFWEHFLTLFTINNIRSNIKLYLWLGNNFLFDEWVADWPNVVFYRFVGPLRQNIFQSVKIILLGSISSSMIHLQKSFRCSLILQLTLENGAFCRASISISFQNFSQ